MKQSLQIKRNYNIFPSKNEAVSHLNDINPTLKDGEIVLCRYKENENIKTLIGIACATENGNFLTSFDSMSAIGKGLQRTNNGTLEVKLSNKNNETNYLIIDKENNGLKVTNMNANDVMTKEIQIIGTPLADIILEKNPSFSSITASNIQDVLTTLLCQELWPNEENIKSKTGSVTASIKAPTITLSSSATTLEVGTKISASTISFNGNSYANITNSLVSGMSYGYSFENDNNKDSDNTSFSKSATTGIVQTATTQMVCTLTGFTQSAFQQITGTTTLSKENYDLGQIKDGTNKITIAITGQPITYSIEEIPVLYPTSNIGKTSGTCVTTKINAVSGTTTTSTNSNSKTINGVRYGFYGIITDDPEILGQESFEYNSTNIRKMTPLKSKKTFTIVGDNVGRVIIALPSSWNAEIKSITDAEQMNNDLYGSETGYPSQYKEVSVEGANNYTAEVYHVYTFDPQSPVKINQTITFK